MNLIDYLQQHFLTREQLLARCGIDGERLEQLQDLGMMPRPSYRLRLDLACESFFGPHAQSHDLEWYAHGYVSWAGLLEALDGPREAYRVFAQRYRQRVAQLDADQLVLDPQALTADAHLESEWKHFLDGTYGLCTRSGLPEEIAAKEASVVLIRSLTEAAAQQDLDDGARQRLAAAVDLLDRASSPFAPHEVARSSRQRWVNEVRSAWRLQA